MLYCLIIPSDLYAKPKKPINNWFIFFEALFSLGLFLPGISISCNVFWF